MQKELWKKTKMYLYALHTITTIIKIIKKNIFYMNNHFHFIYKESEFRFGF